VYGFIEIDTHSAHRPTFLPISRWELYRLIWLAF